MFLPRGEGVAPKWSRPYHYHTYAYTYIYILCRSKIQSDSCNLAALTIMIIHPPYLPIPYYRPNMATVRCPFPLIVCIEFKNATDYLSLLGLVCYKMGFKKEVSRRETSVW